MKIYTHERDPSQVAADALEDSTDAIKSAAAMRADLAKAKAASATGDSAFDAARSAAYAKAKWMRD